MIISFMCVLCVDVVNYTQRRKSYIVGVPVAKNR